MSILNLISAEIVHSDNNSVQRESEKTMDFEKKYEMYFDLVYRICLVRLGSKENAEDATQNVFIKLYSKSPHFNSDEEEKAWLIRVSVNACKDFNKSFWQKNTVGLDEVAEISDGGFEIRQKLIDIFNLPPKCRTVLQLYYYEGYSEKEIANMLHITEKSVAMQLYRARKRLKNEMEASAYEK